MCVHKLERILLFIVSVAFFAACSPKQVVKPVSTDINDVGVHIPETESFAESALKEKVSEPLSDRPSWMYYRYALEAMDNQEWALARHYLDESLRLLVSEKYDTLYRNVSPAEDSAYRVNLPQRIVRALDEVFPNIADKSDKTESLQKNEVSIEGIEALDDDMKADSASLQVIENFLDTVDVARFSLPVEFNERVMQEIYYLTNKARVFTETALNRKTAYDSLIYSQLELMNMPKDLIYLALVESGFKVNAYSRAKASGMWQFIPETAKHYGLDVDFWVDLRRNPEIATIAALKYLNRLYSLFDDWLLAMAAYNCGANRVRRMIKETTEDSTWDSTKTVTYWDLNLPKETMHYVPRILAAMVIGHFPDQYEMEITPQSQPDFDTVTVFDSFALEEVAKVLGVPEDTLRVLNMELVKWCTPPNRDKYLLRVPVGTRSALVEGYDRMEKNSFSGWQHHKVKKGENLSVISRKYGVSVAEIKQANDLKNTRLRAGKSLLIPIKVIPKKSNGKKPVKIKTYVAKSGDTFGSISRLFGVSQDVLRTWNSRDAASTITPGDTLYVSKPESKRKSLKKNEASAKPRKEPLRPAFRPDLKTGEVYVVKSSDSYTGIAKEHGIPVVLLMNANDAFHRRLVVGDTIVIPKYASCKKLKRNDKAEPVESIAPVENVASVARENVETEVLEKTPLTTEPKAEDTVAENDSYIVQTGDNLIVVARKFGMTVADIQRLNDMEDSTIYIGQRLKVRGGSVPFVQSSGTVKAFEKEILHEVKKGEGLWDISRQYRVTIEDIVRWNNLSDTKIRFGDKLKIKQ